LLGELWLLRRLLTTQGSSGLSAWVGQSGETHDFRLEQQEIEVKVTRGVTRIHVINNLLQLLPSPGNSLFLLSLQLAAAGLNAGFSLPDEIRNIRHLLAASPSDAARFELLLDSECHYADRDAAHYLSRFQLRTPARLVPVNSDCPRITPQLIDTLGVSLANRISHIQYRVNVDGLGFAQTSVEFAKILPGVGDQ